jgi:hypothetical protein
VGRGGNDEDGEDEEANKLCTLGRAPTPAVCTRLVVRPRRCPPQSQWRRRAQCAAYVNGHAGAASQQVNKPCAGFSTAWLPRGLPCAHKSVIARGAVVPHLRQPAPPSPPSLPSSRPSHVCRCDHDDLVPARRRLRRRLHHRARLPFPALSAHVFTARVAQPGDIVALNHGNYGRTEGLVVGSHIDYAVRALPSCRPLRH